MKLLDVGCGPGTITVGLAEAVAPGEVVGIDREPGQIERARGLPEAQSGRIRFEVADAYALPFPDEYFDALFTHTVVMHLQRPIDALQEMRRVLKPGGVIGVRDQDWETTLLAPPSPLLEEWKQLRSRVHNLGGGDAFRARNSRQLLLEAGFVRTEGSASVTSAGTMEATRQQAVFSVAQLAGTGKRAIKEGWIDEAKLEAMRKEIEAWGERPDAFYVRTWCEAVGWK
jgi:SAM-dependent methyltransferase